ncbi:MAG: carbamoyltransferase HypF [Candidatus Thermoplasmatota archaeon]|jgi:hydrogenase maturation protein HypF|nr:carbamoyltransferase HypF [Candidatus Thermoplasmatota archaeon]
MMTNSTKFIFKGIVQGVGFRPTIYRVATKMGLKGYVLNTGSEVEVVVDKNPNKFIEQIKKELPPIAKIDEIIIEKDNRVFKDFRILHSKEGEKQSQVPADIATCDDCLEEIFNTKNRRYLFPFTNCTVCGARFSLIKDVPYDRERTSMSDFKLCEKCEEEYKNPADRRYHAQTISCPFCGPEYRLYDKKKRDLGGKDAIQRFARYIDDGSIGVIKSWGGMHICCKIDEIKHFREWYHRPQKSFAVMVKNIKTAGKYGYISKDERKLLLSANKPVVLVKKKKAEDVSPGLNTIGLYLPYTGLHHILFSFLESDAVIMTSANIPGEPMITSNDEVFSLGADYYLLHNRGIPNRVDDSVVRVWKGNRFFLRKSRGFVPEPFDVTYDKNVVSVGAGENICGAVSCNNKLYATQYIGDSKYYSVLEFLEQGLRHLMRLIMDRKVVDAVAMDLHPGYNSRESAKKFSEEFSAPFFEVQHHWAHAASLLLDNEIDESVVLTLDGLGYGSDGTFWGGEVLVSSFDSFERVGHLEYIPLLGGDRATMDPRRLVFAIFKKFDEEKYFTGKEADVLSKIMSKSPKSSSFGRVLDALSCYLDICEKRTYDGEPAMKLERYLALGKPKYSFDTEVKNGVVGTTDLFREVEEKIKTPFTETQKADIAYSMVKSIVDKLVEIAVENAKENSIKTIGLTGGVSYNIPINEMVEKQVNKAGLKLIVHNRVPNGDGGISIGQNVIVGHKL